jgi:hypothetical protein
MRQFANYKGNESKCSFIILTSIFRPPSSPFDFVPAFLLAAPKHSCEGGLSSFTIFFVPLFLCCFKKSVSAQFIIRHSKFIIDQIAVVANYAIPHSSAKLPA